jgi:hypothetical protein
MKYQMLKNKLTGERKILIVKTGEKILESENPVLYAELRKKAITSRKRQEREQFFIDLGLVKGKTCTGKTIWE